jgi:hypothetical protein
MDSPEVQEAVLGVIADVEAAHWEEAAEAEQRLLHWRPDSRFPNQTLQSSLAQKHSRGSRAARGLEPPPPELRCPPASARPVHTRPAREGPAVQYKINTACGTRRCMSCASASELLRVARRS